MVKQALPPCGGLVISPVTWASEGRPVRISVVIPTYNAADRLVRTIEAALGQTAPAHEVIVVDDGSTDGTPAACADFGTRIRVLRVGNGGQQRARNLGVAAATGDWLALLDHDDLWDPTYLAETGALMAGGAVDLILCNSRTVEERDGVTRVRVADRFRHRAPQGYWEGLGVNAAARYSLIERYGMAAYLAFHPAVPTVTTMRRDFYLALGGFDPALRGNSAENFEFELRALRQGRVGLVWQPLASVVRYGGNASADGAKMAMDLVACLEFVLARHGLSPAQADVVEAELQRRLPDAIDGAFRHGDVQALRQYGARISRQPGLRARVKCALAQLPERLARLAIVSLHRHGIAREGQAGR
jgi:GT2 family glycosyltransferase